VVDLEVLGLQLDSMILQVFSELNDSVRYARRKQNHKNFILPYTY